MQRLTDRDRHLRRAQHLLAEAELTPVQLSLVRLAVLAFLDADELGRIR